MKDIPAWVDGALFGVLFGPLMFALKIFCPRGADCFADPFLVVVFSPILLLQEFFSNARFEMWQEIIYITVFWGIVMAIIAHLGSTIIIAVQKNSPDRDSDISGTIPRN